MSAGTDKLVKLWNPFGNYSQPIQAYSGHSWDVVDIAMYTNPSCDQKLLIFGFRAADNVTFASVGGDRACFYWDVSTGRIIRRFQGHSQRLTSVAYSDAGNVIASGSVDKSVRLWDCRSNSRLPIQILDDAKDTIGDIEFHSTEMLVGSIDGYARVYDIRNFKLFQDNLGEPVTKVKYTSDGLVYLAGCQDSTIRLVDRADGSVLNKFQGHKSQDYRSSFALSNDDGYVWAGSEDGSIYAWDFVSANVVKTLTGHKGPVSSLAYHPKDDIVISASHDGTIRVWR